MWFSTARRQGRNSTRYLSLVAGVLAGAWAVTAAFGMAGYGGWTGELLSNFPIVPLLAAGLSIGLLSWFAGRRGVFPGLVFLTATVCGSLLPRPGLPHDAAAGNSLKFATWNAYLGTLDPVAAANWIRENDPDLVAFTEITRPLRDRLRVALGSAYPYVVGNARNGPSGIMVFSKVPVTDWQRVPKSSSPHASIDVTWPDGRLCKVFVIHAPVPTGDGFNHRARVFEELAGVIGRQPCPVMVLGDFNSTWASKDFRNFCRSGGLLPATDFRSSWNAWLPGALRIPIDHVLASAVDFSAIRSTSGSRGFGSDHLPVMAEISLRSRPPAIAVTR